jgi:hypothetical protein
VTGVGGELPLTPAGVLDAVEHVVQGPAEPGHLVLGATQLQPTREVLGVEGAGLRAEVGHGGESPPCEEPSHEPGQQTGEGRERAGQTYEGGLDVRDGVHLDGEDLDRPPAGVPGSCEDALSFVAVMGLGEQGLFAEHDLDLVTGEERGPEIIVGRVEHGAGPVEQLRLDLRGLDARQLALVDLDDGNPGVAHLPQCADQCAVEIPAQRPAQLPVGNGDQHRQRDEEHRREGGTQPDAQRESPECLPHRSTPGDTGTAIRYPAPRTVWMSCTSNRRSIFSRRFRT